VRVCVRVSPSAIGGREGRRYEGRAADGCACEAHADISSRPKMATRRRLDRKTMHHCALGHLVVTIRQGGPAPLLRVGSKNILEGQCASRARLRITQCKRST
jgi:hypothetical protein